jgi:6,7-dimethyl-8-ribityllumazine synthase
MSQHNSALLQLTHLPESAKVAIVHTEWNETMVAAMISGATNIAEQCGVTVTQQLAVPGCFELPYSIKHLWENSTNKPEAIIAFGAVIRGGTPHFDYVCKAVTEGILQLNLSLPVPVIFGVLTLDNEQQGWERLGGEYGHKGEEAMITALKMIQISRTAAQL